MDNAKAGALSFRYLNPNMVVATKEPLRNFLCAITCRDGLWMLEDITIPLSSDDLSEVADEMNRLNS